MSDIRFQVQCYGEGKDGISGLREEGEAVKAGCFWVFFYNCLTGGELWVLTGC